MRQRKTKIFEDSIITGILLTKGHKVTPTKNPNNKVVFKVEGNVEKSIQEIYSNCSVGALDVMCSIKLTRSMIFNLRQQR